MVKYRNMTEDEKRAEIEQYMIERKKNAALIESIRRGDPIEPSITKTYSIEERHAIMDQFMASLANEDDRPSYSNDDLFEMKDKFFMMVEYMIEARQLIERIDRTIEGNDE